MAGAKFQGQNSRNKFWAKVILGLLFLFLIVLLRGVWGMYKKDNLAKANLTSAREDVASLETRKRELQSKLVSLQTRRGMESEIRQKFSVVKEGEKVITIVDNKASTSSTTAIKKPWWKKMFGG